MTRHSYTEKACLGCRHDFRQGPCGGCGRAIDTSTGEEVKGPFGAKPVTTPISGCMTTAACIAMTTTTSVSQHQEIDAMTTPDSSIAEAVAKALFISHCSDEALSWEDQSDYSKANWRRLAQASIDTHLAELVKRVPKREAVGDYVRGWNACHNAFLLEGEEIQ